MTTERLTHFSTPSDLEIVALRVVKAPRALVWEVYTRPEHVRTWMLGPPGWTMVTCEMDLRVGGAWRWVWRDQGGAELALSGAYREVTRPVRLVSTESWGPTFPETVNTVTFTEEAGRTTIRTSVVYPSLEARDAALGSGMAEGMEATFHRLDAHLEGPQRFEAEPVRAAFVPLRIPRAQIGEVMGPGLAELRATLAAQGVSATGPWFTHHLRMEPGVFDFRIGLPVDRDVTAAGRVVPGTLDLGPCVRGVLLGGYEGLAGAWPRLDAWIGAQGLTARPDLVEVYASDPSSPEGGRTELFRPLDRA